MVEFKQSRRSFVRMAAAAGAALPILSSLQTPKALAATFDPSFGTATAALAALRARKVSSRELTDHVLARIAAHDPTLHAFVTVIADGARAAARAADEAEARREPLGPLHGLPVLVKDEFLTAGVRTTAASAEFAQLVPTEDAVVVARLKRAGAIIVGKTNLPDSGQDWQSFNPIAGTASNPWDLTRTPGGSTGGGAAALAAGLGFLEVGSDIGGSVRIPSHFCGIYGHKPTHDLVPIFGHLPPPPGVRWPMPLLVAGPMARSPEDLLLELSVIGGPEEDIALRWTLPPPRKKQLSGYRIGYVLEHPFCPLDAEVRRVLEAALDALRRAGATLVEGFPAGVAPQAAHDLYGFIMGAVMAVNLPPEERARRAELLRAGERHPRIVGSVATHLDYQFREEERLQMRGAFQRYFGQLDAFVCPVTFTAAFPHDHSMPLQNRSIQTSGGPRPYLDIEKWPCFANLLGLPATSAPVGRTASGLPVGLQIIGPAWEDATPIDIAAKLTREVGGFEPPPAFV